MKQIAWVKVIQNKYIKRCISIVGIVIVLLGAMLLYHITGLRKNEYTKKEPLLLNWTVVSENQTDTDVDLNTFRFDNILTDKKTIYLSRTFVDKGQFQSPFALNSSISSCCSPSLGIAMLCMPLPTIFPQSYRSSPEL